MAKVACASPTEKQPTRAATRARHVTCFISQGDTLYTRSTIALSLKPIAKAAHVVYSDDYIQLIGDLQQYVIFWKFFYGQSYNSRSFRDRKQAKSSRQVAPIQPAPTTWLCFSSFWVPFVAHTQLTLKILLCFLVVSIAF